MNVIGINGSARKGWNTHALLQKALEGAESKGAQTEMVNLYDLMFRGCFGCLLCKLKGGEVGRCAVKDDLKPVFDRIAECDAFILGSPIYIGETTGEMRAFYERLIFQYISYDEGRIPQFDRKIKTAFIFTTNCPENAYEEVGYVAKFEEYEHLLRRIFGDSRTLAVSETWQIDDYDKYHMSMFDVPAKRRRREEVFPKDCEKAFKLGEWLAEGTIV